MFFVMSFILIRDYRFSFVLFFFLLGLLLIVADVFREGHKVPDRTGIKFK